MMAGVFQKNNKKPGSAQEWKTTGSFMRKPTHGWPQSDDKLIHGGVTYNLRYVGNVEVKHSMRTLHFDMRGQVTKEAVFNVCNAVGLRIGDKKRKINKTAAKILGDCDVRYGSANVEVNISTKDITITLSTTGQIISRHEMQTISFASGGDMETRDYVSYVAKDPSRRACYVLECVEGMADQVIATIGQAFEIRFKSYLQNPPKAIATPDRLEEPIFGGDVTESAWGEEPEYYNNLDKLPPLPPQANYQTPNSFPVDDGDSDDGAYTYVKEPLAPGPIAQGKTEKTDRVKYDNIDFQTGQPQLMETDNDEFYDKLKLPMHEFDDSIYSTAGAAAMPGNQLPANQPPPTNPSGQLGGGGQYSFQSPGNQPPANQPPPTNPSGQLGGGGQYSFRSPVPSSQAAPPAAGLPPPPPRPAAVAAVTKPPAPIESQYSFQSAAVRVLPATPATSATTVQQQQPKPSPAPRPIKMVSEDEPVYSSGLVVSSLESEEWFHGPLTRKQSEELLEENGDFLVREKGKGQYVLSGMQNSQAKHLMLVDPNGIVRTKEKVFHSVSHLVNYHRDNKLPIVSAGSAVRLLNPVFCELRAVYSGVS